MYPGGYILVDAKKKDPIFMEDPGYDLGIHCMGSAMA
jgi:hypothetical protein